MSRFTKAHVNFLGQGRGLILADEIRLDRQFAMPAIHQHRELNAPGSPEIVERIHGRSDCAPAEQHVVHQHDGFARHVEGDDRRMNLGRSSLVKIVAVHGNIQVAARHGLPQISARRVANRSAKGPPPRWMPTSTTSALASLRSAISWAIRVSARWMAGALRMTLASGMARHVMRDT